MNDPRRFLPINRHGIAADAVMIALNLFLFPIFSGRVGHLFDESFKDNSGAVMTLAGLMFLILCGRLTGIYLKRFPLQARLSGQTTFPLYFLVFNIPVFLLTAAFVAILFFAALGQFQIVETNYDGSPQHSRITMLMGTFGIFTLLCVEVFLLLRLTKPLSPAEEQSRANGNWKYGNKGEFLADLGLFSYLMVWIVFYNQTAAVLLEFPANVTETLELKIISVIFLFICFLVFYLSPRAIFLIDDRRHWGTWLFISLVFLSSIAMNW